MKREEKNQQTRQKILTHALCEFAQNGYQGASLNAVCQSGGISKGIIYHYFDSRDDLYLRCLETCFQALTATLTEHLADCGDSGAESRILRYFGIRLGFFRQNPDFARMFCEAVVMPPIHLKAEIDTLRRPFDRFNNEILRGVLREHPLRPDLTEEEIIDIFRRYQDFLNAGFRPDSGGAFDMERHERECKNALTIFLYGIFERKDD